MENASHSTLCQSIKKESGYYEDQLQPIVAEVYSDCAYRAKSYSRQQNLVRNVRDCMQPRISKVSSNQRYECALCGNSYNRRQNLVRHIRACSAKGYNQFCCDDCDKTFLSNSILKRHLKTVHNKLPETKNECPVCHKTFNRRDSLRRHVRSCERRCCISKFVCAYCYKSFQKKEKLRIHIKRRHTHPKCVTVQSDRFKCVLCGIKFSSSEYIIHHIISSHDIVIEHEHLRFSTISEFYSWKSEMQKNTTSVLVKVRCHVGQKYKVSWFKCHRSGSFKSRVTNRHRRIKLQGSMKIGGYCPAEITLFEDKNNNSCKVSFVRTHLGHNIRDEAELAHMYLSDEEKNKLAGKISMGVPYNRILTDNVDLINKEPNLDPLYLLNKQSLHNISATYHVRPSGGRLEKEEPYSVDSFIAQYQESIIFYKEQDEIHPIVETLVEEDVIVIVMTKEQEDMFKKFGNDIVTIDGTFGVNAYDFVLHTIFVIDEWYEGVPVALALSNRNDQYFTDLFLTVVKQKIGNLSTKTFLSEMKTTYLSSWIKIMGPIQYELYCKWHVDDTWRKNARKIANVEKRNELLTRLYALSTCLDEHIFHTDLRKLLNDSDDELQPFLQYFRTNFSKNVKSWAYCYRTNAGINSNIHVKTFDRCLKYFDCKFVKSASLTTCLSLLNDYMELQKKELARKRIFGKLSLKLRDLRKKHDVVVKNNLTITVENIDDPFVGWLVSVSEENDETWNVHAVRKKKMHCSDCKLYCEECESCLHLYECTCHDNCIEYNMCVHIHGLCLYFKRNAVSRSAFNSDRSCNSYEITFSLDKDVKPQILDSDADQPKIKLNPKTELSNNSFESAEDFENDVREMQESYLKVCEQIKSKCGVVMLKRIVKATEEKLDALDVNI